MTKEKTMDVISDSFYQLVKEYSMEKISVNMICEASGVSRSTFYRLFRDKYDVMNYFFQKYCEDQIAAHQDPKDCKAFLQDYANLIRRYRKYFHSALSVEGQNSFSDFLYEYGYRYYSSMVRIATGAEPSTDMDIKLKIFTSGTVFITREWISGRIDVTPQHLAEIVYEAMPPELARYLS